MNQSQDVVDLEQEVIHREDMFVEFTKLVHHYSKAKQLLHQEFLLDSLHRVHRALDHMARLAVLEAGEKPKVKLWRQVKNIDHSVYKLYEELSTSKESLNKRIELFLLALDFAVLSKMERSAAYIVDLLKDRKGIWTPEEIIHFCAIDDQDVGVHVLLDKLAQKSILRTHIVEQSGMTQKGYSYL